MADYYVLANAIVVDSTNNVLRVTEGTAGAFDVTLTSGTYFLAEDSGSGADQFCEMLQTVLEARSTAVGDGNGYTVQYRANVGVGAYTGTVEITSDGTTIQVNGGHANTTFDPTWIGFPASDSTAGLSTLSKLSPVKTWCGAQPRVRITPGPYDSELHQYRTPGGQVHTFRASEVWEGRTLEFRNEDELRTWTEFNASDEGATFESFWRQARDGSRVRLYEQSISTGSTLSALTSSDVVGTYVMAEASCRTLDMQRRDDGQALYQWMVELRKYVA